MSGSGVILGIVATLIIVALCWLVRQIYEDGNTRVKYRMRRIYFQLKFKAVHFDCISCGGEGSRTVSGSFASGAPGPDIVEECVWCDGTGKEKVGYAYRGIFAFLNRANTASEREEDQRQAEMVLGPAQWRFDKGLQNILGGK